MLAIGSRPSSAVSSSDGGNQVLRTTPAFGELRVADGRDTCLVDLVAEPFTALAPPDQASIERTFISVDGKPELLASKLGTLSGPRSVTCRT
jgi:hypothetical protein